VVPNAEYFKQARTPAELFFEHTLSKTNKEREQKSEPKLKMRHFMTDAHKMWSDLPSDDQMPFMERFKALCDESNVEFKEEAKKEEKKKGAKKKSKASGEEKENNQPAENEAEDSAEKMDVEENNDESAEVKKSKKRKAKEPADEEPKSKKPMKGYFRWLHGPDSGKAKYRTENPDASKEDEKDALKAAWASLSEEDKMALDTSYEEEMKAWEEAHPEEVAAAKAKEDEKAATKQAKADADAAKDKRPLSGYFRFMNEFRPKFLAENPDLEKKFAKAGQAAGAAWRELSEEEKKPYNDACEEEMTAWRKRNGKPEPAAKEVKAPKPPKSAMAVFIADEFKAQYKAQNPEAKAAEMNVAAKTAWEALSEDDRKAWDVKYGARLEELGTSREEQEQAEAEEKSGKAGYKLFVKDDFADKFKESNPDVKKGSKEYTAAAKEAWEALSEEVQAEWSTKVEEVPEAEEGAAEKPKAKKLAKPTKLKARSWKDLYLAAQVEKIKVKSPDKSEEDLLVLANLKLKSASKAEQLGFKDKAKTEKAKVDKINEEAVKEYEAKLNGEGADEETTA